MSLVVRTRIASGGAKRSGRKRDVPARTYPIETLLIKVLVDGLPGAVPVVLVLVFGRVLPFLLRSLFKRKLLRHVRLPQVQILNTAHLDDPVLGRLIGVGRHLAMHPLEKLCLDHLELV